MALDALAHDGMKGGTWGGHGRPAIPGEAVVAHVVVVIHSKGVGVVLACNEAAALVRSGEAVYNEEGVYKLAAVRNGAQGR